jgi:hypothetical protein
MAMWQLTTALRLAARIEVLGTRADVHPANDGAR